MTWTDKLPTIDPASLPAFYPDASQAVRNVKVMLPEGRAFRRKVRRAMFDRSQVADAVRQIDRLPEPGEAHTHVMATDFAGWDVVPAILRLAAPVTVRELVIGTLGFSDENLSDLCRRLDSGEIASVIFCCFAYFRSVDSDIFERCYEALKARSQRAVAVRNHAKLLLLTMTDGRAYVVESTANLRSCRNTEIFTLSQDAALLAFHRGWLLDLIAATDREQGR